MVSALQSRHTFQKRCILCFIAIVTILFLFPVYSYTARAVDRPYHHLSFVANANYDSCYRDPGRLLANDQKCFIPWNFYCAVVYTSESKLFTSTTTNLATTVPFELENIISADTTRKNVELGFVYKGIENE